MYMYTEHQRTITLFYQTHAYVIIVTLQVVLSMKDVKVGKVFNQWFRLAHSEATSMQLSRFEWQLTQSFSQ